MVDEKVTNKVNLVEAHTFFENETEEFRKKMEVENLLVDIACEFIKFRSENNLTQKGLAKKLQITQAMVSKLESGEYNPTIKMLFDLAQKMSWNFKIEFNDISKKYNYEYSSKDTLVSNCKYVENMGLAS